MSRLAVVLAGLLVGFALAWGCGLDAVGSRVDVDSDGGPPGRNDATARCNCDDPACTTSTCVAVPTGWTLATLALAEPSNADAGARDAGAPSCPAGWANPRAFVAAPRPRGNMCACRCGTTPPGTNTCTPPGTVTVGVDTDDNGFCLDATHDVQTDGGCHPVFDWTGVDRIAFFAVGPNNNPCPMPPPAMPPIVDDGALTLCEVPGGASACANGACVPKPGSFAICAVRPGAEPACPPGFGTPRVLREAAAIVDGRSCGPGCACRTTTSNCNNERLDFYSDALCTTLIRTANAGGLACNAPSGSGTPLRYRYAAMPDTVACTSTGAATVGVDGGVELPPETTVCCPQ